jgi:hypothetical protein
LNKPFGVAFVIVGLLTGHTMLHIFTGAKLPVSFWKLTPMQDRGGKIPGTLLHFFGYVSVPIVFGILLLLGYWP